VLRIFRLNVPLKGTTDRRISNTVWGATIAQGRERDGQLFFPSSCGAVKKKGGLVSFAFEIAESISIKFAF